MNTRVRASQLPGSAGRTRSGGLLASGMSPGGVTGTRLKTGTVARSTSMLRTAVGERAESHLQQGRPSPFQAQLGQSQRGAQTLRYAGGVADQRPVDPAVRRVQENDVHVVVAEPGQAEVEGGWDGGAGVQDGAGERGDRPVEHGAARDPADGVDGDPDAHLEALAGGPQGFADDREFGIAGPVSLR